MIAPGRYSEVLVQEFYVSYKGEMMRLYPQEILWKRGKPITFFVIRGVRVDNSSQTIERFLYGLVYQASANTDEMDYRMAKMRQITNQTLGTEDKMVMFRQIDERITAHGEHDTWVAGGIGDLQKIKKSSLTFEGKAGWTIDCYRLCLTTGDDILIPFWVATIGGFTNGFAFDVSQFLA